MITRSDIADSLDAPRPELDVRPYWQQTGDLYFPMAAVVGGRRWVLRLNNFPDHPLWTLFVEGVRRFDLQGTPREWASAADRTAPLMDPGLARQIVGAVAHYEVYGSEIGEPCGGVFCGCLRV
ncbi:hypothetical protein [Nocardia sp. NPDC051570]|uniref:hypothetical protein n=1 Tax=Nocardia sp. NPDC051570 TaxID=3364324 RepID=UPI003793134E